VECGGSEILMKLGENKILGHLTCVQKNRPLGAVVGMVTRVLKYHPSAELVQYYRPIEKVSIYHTVVPVHSFEDPDNRYLAPKMTNLRKSKYLQNGPTSWS
jgi:hypothetical protein